MKGNREKNPSTKPEIAIGYHKNSFLLLFQREAKPFPAVLSRYFIYRLTAIEFSLGKAAPEKSSIYNTHVIIMSI